MSKYGSEFGIDIPEDAYDDTAFSNQYATQTPAYDDTEFANLYATQPENSNVTYADEYHKGVGGGDGKDNSYSSVGVDPSTLNDPTKFDFSKFLGNLKNQFSGIGGKIQDNPLQSLLFAALAARALTGGNRPTSTGGYTGPGINMGLKATRSPIAPINYKPYSGQPIYGPQDSSQVTYAAGGGLMGLAGGGMSKRPRYLSGNTDGMADKIDTSIDDREPAKLSHGEFVIPADVVSHLGNGNSDAGADVLYKMMDKVRMARTGRKKQGKQINPSKFMPGGAVEDAKYVEGGDVKGFNGTTGSSVTTPTGSTTAQNLSSWAGPYVTDYLSKGQALANTPYQSFTQWSGGNVPLTAGSSPLQQQAYQGLSSLVGGFGGSYGTSYGGGYGQYQQPQYQQQYQPQQYQQQYQPQQQAQPLQYQQQYQPQQPAQGGLASLQQQAQQFASRLPQEGAGNQLGQTVNNLASAGIGPSAFDSEEFKRQQALANQQMAAAGPAANGPTPDYNAFYRDEQGLMGGPSGVQSGTMSPDDEMRILQAQLGATPAGAKKVDRTIDFDPNKSYGSLAQANLMGHVSDYWGREGGEPTTSGPAPRSPGGMPEPGRTYPAERPVQRAPAPNQSMQQGAGYPSQYDTATNFATQAGLNAQRAQYNQQNVYAPLLSQYQMNQPQDVTGQTTTAATLGSAPTATAQTGTAASAGTAPSYTGQTANAAQLGPYQKMTAQTGTAASAGAAPEMQGQTAQAAQLGPYTKGIAALGNAAQAGAAPSFSGEQFQAPGQIGYQTVAGERVNAPSLRDLSMQAATSDWMPNLQMFQMKAPTPVQAASAGIATLGESPEMRAARLAASPEAKAALTDYQAKLQNYQMGPAERVGTQSILEGPGVGAYMSPYMQNVVDIQNREARRQADITRQADQARLAQAGAYGGSRQAIIDAERNRNLATQMGDIQEKGLQSAFQQAQQQFNTEQQARMQANLANQQAGLTVGQQNLAANLGVQQLGTQTGLQTALANQQAQQQTALANQALAGQYGLTQGQFEQAAAAANQQMKGQYGMTGAQLAQSAYNTNAQLAQQAALANQQAEFNAAQQNLAAALGVQSLGANLGQQMALANLGNQQQANVQNLSAGLQTQGLQAQTGMQSQQLNQATGLQALLANQQAGINTGQFNAQMGYNTALQNAQLAQQAGLANQQVGAQFGLANLGNQQQMAMANLGNQQATNMANQQAANQFALAQAGYTQQAGLQTSAQAQQAAAANQALAGQYGLTNAQMAQQMGLANLGNQQAAAAANQQAANQFALAQAGYGQQANMQTSQQLQQQQLANQALAGQYGLSNAQMAQQMGLANLGNQQQTALANQAMLGQYGLTQGGYNQAAAMQNAQLAQQAALANQQAGLTTGQQNLAAKLGVQNLAAQQNLQAQLANQQAGQFGANFGLQANQQQLAAAQALAGIGQGQFGTQLAGLQALLGAGTQQQQTEQAGIAALQNEYNKQMMYPYQQLQFQQGLLSGLPVAAATNTPNTSPLSQLYGGAGDLMAFYQKMFGGSKP